MKLEGELQKLLSFVIIRNRHFEEKKLEGFKLGLSRQDITTNYKMWVVAMIMVGLNFKIVNNAAGTIFVTATNGHDWQPYGILRPLSKI